MNKKYNILYYNNIPNQNGGNCKANILDLDSFEFDPDKVLEFDEQIKRELKINNILLKAKNTNIEEIKSNNSFQIDNSKFKPVELHNHNLAEGRIYYILRSDNITLTKAKYIQYIDDIKVYERMNEDFNEPSYQFKFWNNNEQRANYKHFSENQISEKVMFEPTYIMGEPGKSLSLKIT